MQPGGDPLWNEVDVTVDYAVEEYGNWKDVCEGVVREKGYRLGDNRVMLLDRGSPCFTITLPENMTAEEREKLVGEVAAECAQVLDLQNQLRSVGLVRKLREAEAAIKEAASLTRQARDAAQAMKQGIETASSAVELAGKAASAWSTLLRLLPVLSVLA